MNATTVLLIDMGSVAVPIYMTTANAENPDEPSIQIVDRVRALTREFPHAAICLDAGRCFRHDIDATYKGQRPERDARLHHQIGLAVDRLRQDGYPVWQCPGFEADDVIASATRAVLEHEGWTVRIVTTDKDLHALVSDRVVIHGKDGATITAEKVGEKFGVRPAQIPDWLCLVGDSADNVKGAEGIGPTTAASLLAAYGTLDALYATLKTDGGAMMGLKPKVIQSLKAFEARLDTVRSLITLRTDVPVPLDEAMQPRAIPDLTTEEDVSMATETDFQTVVPNVQPAPVADAPPQPAAPVVAEPPTAQVSAQHHAQGIVRHVAPEVLPVEYERQLDPRSMAQAQALAENMYKSRMFEGYGNAPAVLSTIMVGRELGMPAMASLRGVYNIEGRHSLSASLMVALVLRSGLAEYFEPVSFSETEATYETKRVGARNPVKLTHTIEMARTAWPKAKEGWEKAFLGSGWGRNPTDMLVARATSRLARMVYPDLLAGLYTPEELIEIRGGTAA